MWSTARSCFLSIFYPFLLHTHISSFIVFVSLLSFAPLLPFRLYFPVAHSTLLGYFLWYTNVSLPFNLSVYLPLLPLLLCLPVHSLRLLSLLPACCFPSLSSSSLRLSPLVCCNTPVQHQGAVEAFIGSISRCCDVAGLMEDDSHPKPFLFHNDIYGPQVTFAV